MTGGSGRAPRRVLITGSRNWVDLATLRAALADVWGDGTAVLVSGGCPTGADHLAEALWTKWGGRVERHRADWTRDGRAAAFRRNARMVATGADVCLAFIRGGSRGASHTAHLAQAAGIPTHRHTPDTAARGLVGGAALFGPSPTRVAPTRRTARARPATNDMDLIEAVIKTARDPGYVLIGTAQRVFRRCPDTPGVVQRAPDYEDAAVHQLLAAKLLRVGGAEHVRAGRHEGRAGLVVAPSSTARMADRWASYVRPASSGGGEP